MPEGSVGSTFLWFPFRYIFLYSVVQFFFSLCSRDFVNRILFLVQFELELVHYMLINYLNKENYNSMKWFENALTKLITTELCVLCLVLVHCGIFKMSFGTTRFSCPCPWSFYKQWSFQLERTGGVYGWRGRSLLYLRRTDKYRLLCWESKQSSLVGTT